MTKRGHAREDVRRYITMNTRLPPYTLLVALVAITTIMLVAGLGLRSILLDLALRESERDAIRVSAALRDGYLERFIQLDSNSESALVIPDEKVAELDIQMRNFLSSFDIVKIKIFDRHTRIIYSTDEKIMGQVDTNNANLAMALRGRPVSKHEQKGQVKDLEDEERFNVEIVETYVPVRGDDGRVVGGLRIYKDVTSDIAGVDRALRWTIAVILVVVAGVVMIVVGTLYFTSPTLRTRTTDTGHADGE